MGAFAGWLLGVLFNNTLVLKAVLFFLFIVVLPIVLHNFVYDLFSEILNIALSHLPGNVREISINLSGLGAWLFTQLRLDTCIDIIISAISTKFTLRLIPFVRV